MNRTKVLIVRDRPSSGGGICNYYNAIAPHLRSCFQFVDTGRPHSYYGLNVSSLLTYTIIRLTIDWLALTIKVVWFRPNIVHINPCLDPEENCRGLKRDSIAILIAWILRRKILVFWRGWNNETCTSSVFPPGNNGWLHRIYKLADANVVLSSRFKFALERWGFSKPIYVETTVVSDDISGLEITKKLKVSKPVKLLYLSRIEIAKGVYELVDTMRILNKDRQLYTLSIAGDGPELLNLKKYCESKKRDDVTFLGYVSGEEKIRTYQNADLFCFLSYTEGMPNAVLEAMAMGLPVVSSDAGGLKDILQHKKTGVVLKVNSEAPEKSKFSSKLVASEIDTLIRNPEKLGVISKYNRLYALKTFSTSIVASRLEKIYKSLSNNNIN